MSPALNLRWHNYSLAVRIKLSDGAMWLISILVFLLYSAMSIWVKAIDANYLAGCAALVGILMVGLKHEDKKNQLDFDAAAKDLGPRITAIKQDARSQSAPPCPEPEAK
jgi:hypothetical protein